MMTRLAVLDDFFPHPISGFRFEEFRTYLDELPEVSIYCNGNSLGLVTPRIPVETLIAEHVAAYPQHAGRVHPIKLGELPEADVYYAVFLENIRQYIDLIERTGKRFALTLYPGGGLQFGEAQSEAYLDRVCNSPSLHRILVTQPHTLDRLLQRHPNVEPKVLYLSGGIVPRAAFTAPESRRHFGNGKTTLDIAFIANRYTPEGLDKGYDLFVQTACALTERGIDAIYHVVGPWSTAVFPLGIAASRFKFHDFLSTERLRELAQRFDMVLSPNRPGILAKGAFDGFPTGSCVEAGLQEAAIVCTDELAMNREFSDGRDLVLIRPDMDDILRKILPLIEHPPHLAQIGQHGRSRLTEVFGVERQLPPRLGLLREMMSWIDPSISAVPAWV